MKKILILLLWAITIPAIAQINLDQSAGVIDVTGDIRINGITVTGGGASVTDSVARAQNLATSNSIPSIAGLATGTPVYVESDPIAIATADAISNHFDNALDATGFNLLNDAGGIAVAFADETEVSLGAGVSVFDLNTVTMQGVGDIIPALSNTYTLGTSGRPFKDLYVSSNSIYVGALRLSEVNGSLSVINTGTANEAIYAGVHTGDGSGLTNLPSSGASEAQLNTASNALTTEISQNATRDATASNALNAKIDLLQEQSTNEIITSLTLNGDFLQILEGGMLASNSVDLSSLSGGGGGGGTGAFIEDDVAGVSLVWTNVGTPVGVMPNSGSAGGISNNFMVALDNGNVITNSSKSAMIGGRNNQLGPTITAWGVTNGLMLGCEGGFMDGWSYGGAMIMTRDSELEVKSNPTMSLIAGGRNHDLLGTGTGNAILGGLNSQIDTSAKQSAILAGINGIVSDGDNSVIVGGFDALIDGTSPDQNVILGGNFNEINSADSSVIVGGSYAKVKHSEVVMTCLGTPSPAVKVDSVEASSFQINAINGLKVGGTTNSISGTVALLPIDTDSYITVGHDGAGSVTSYLFVIGGTVIGSIP